MSASTATDLNLSNECSLEQKVESLIQIVADQAETIQEQSETIGDLQDELAEYREESAKDRAETKKRVTELEEQGTGDDNPTPETEESPSPKPETPLEDVVQLPEGVVGDNLSANQERARFVAKDIHQYSKSVPAGRAIKSSELRKVLSAKEDGRIHTQTVSRVIGRLDDLGKDGVQVRETRAGERAVVFSEEIVKRIVAYRNQQDHQVVIGQEVSG